MKKDNDEVLAGKIAFTARASCVPAGVPTFMAYGGATRFEAQEKAKLLDGVRRIRGRVKAVERAFERADRDAALQLIAATRGAINGLIGEVIEFHIRMKLINPALPPRIGAADAAEELIEVVKSYLKYGGAPLRPAVGGEQ